ncbi:MAG TPA: hypothetical protein VGL47_33325 [Amycolatopsis sp.]|uniref:Uncharacterized protein n=1 Tax=Amycolatopsis nalaikhensis TaxID=715472 RepID=A0ABY8XKA7_9PSEU|nr:hypothetical protein [Amycolatopsis sp. 2-2]WIV56044.1 hypothetical protein QP939_45830 [Amycolatopsis sp. 2-2]
MPAQVFPGGRDEPDDEASDLVRLLRQFGIRALVLAAVAGLAGFSMVALAFAVAGFSLLFARVR